MTIAEGIQAAQEAATRAAEMRQHAAELPARPAPMPPPGSADRR